jgi:hypothetical protein
MIKYSSYSGVKPISLIGLGYYFTTDVGHICATRGDKMLRFDYTTCILSLSIDGGRTIFKSLDLTGICTIVTRAKIYANGNIMWADHTKCYYSSDNIATYHLSTIIAIDGGAFTASTYDNFSQLVYEPPLILNGIEIDIWGNYSIAAGTQGVNINCWYSVDSGITIKSCYKSGVSISGQYCDHIHVINYCPIDNSFWMQTGDGNASAVDCHWNKGSYNALTDTWTWTNVKSGDNTSFYKTGGFIFVGDYVFWVSDATGDSNKFGIYKCLYSGITDSANYQRIVTTDRVCQGMYGDSDGVMLTGKFNGATNGQTIYISQDFGVTWTPYTLTNAPVLDGTFNGYLSCMPKNNDGYYKFQVPKLGTTGNDIYKWANLMLRIK